jgi:hypothetical protein
MWDDEREFKKGCLQFVPHLDSKGVWRIRGLGSSGIGHTTKTRSFDLTAPMIERISLQKGNSEISFRAIFERNPEED